MKNDILVGRHCVLTNTEHTSDGRTSVVLLWGEGEGKECQISSMFDSELLTDEQKTRTKTL